MFNLFDLSTLLLAIGIGIIIGMALGNHFSRPPKKPPSPPITITNERFIALMKEGLKIETVKDMGNLKSVRITCEDSHDALKIFYAGALYQKDHADKYVQF